VSRRRAVELALVVLCTFAAWPAAAHAAGVPSAIAALVKQAASHGAAAARQAPRSSGHRLYVPGEVLVEFRTGFGALQRQQVAARLDAQVLRRLPAPVAAAGDTLVLLRSSSLGVRALMKQLAAEPAVVAVSPNCWRRAAGVPDDTYLASQWGLTHVGAADAWQRTTGAAGVVVADVDTGVDLTQPDLAANIWRNSGEIAGNGIDDDHDGYVDDVYGIDAVNRDVVPMDDMGHGTHTSGIMAAVAGNDAGVAGIAPGVKVMALKCIDWRGWGTDAAAIECIDYVIQQKQAGVNVVAINASWGSTPGDRVLRDAIERAGQAGIVFCAAAGNDGSNNDEQPMYPASFDCPTIISVAATGVNDHLTSFSDFGDCSVDIGAPGAGIMSTLPGGRYAAWDGTSMATPFVTGAVALCASGYPAETAEQRVQRILSSARPVAALRGKVGSGGLLDVPAALGLGEAATDSTPPVTVALDAGGPARDIRTTVHLWADDDAKGSGVAATQWRVDGGPWTTGHAAPLPAPRHQVVVHTIEYRSVDNAGNVEAGRSCQVTTDTTASSVMMPPGRPLPPSPVVGGVGRAHPFDMYSVALRRGESFGLTVDGLDSGFGVVALMRLRGHGERPLAESFLDGGVPVRLACRVTATDVYSLVVASSASASYTLSYEIAPPSSDIVAPSVVIGGVRRSWNNRPVAVTARARDDRWGSGVARTEVSLDEGLSWLTSAGVTVDAPADHSNDGFHHVLVRAVDAGGNVSAPHGRWVAIDTQGPSTAAWCESYHRLGRRERRRGTWGLARIGFRTHDLSEGIRCVLVVRSVASGRVVCRRSLGWQLNTDMMWWQEDPQQTALVALPHLARGSYRVAIAGGTRDEAGNHWVKAVCRQPLVVR
jgi:subtilisin family serine protease